MEAEHTTVTEWPLAFRRESAEEKETGWPPDAPLAHEEVLYRILTTVGHPWDMSRTVDVNHASLRADLESALGVDGGLLTPDEPWSSLNSPVTLEDLIITLEAAYLTCWRNAQEFGLQKNAMDHCWSWVTQCAAELGATNIRRETSVSSVLSPEEAEILSFAIDWYAPDGQSRLARFQSPAMFFYLKLLAGLGGSVWCFLLASYSIVPIWLAAVIWLAGGIAFYYTDKAMRRHEWSEPDTTFGALADSIHARAYAAGVVMRKAAIEQQRFKPSPLTVLD